MSEKEILRALLVEQQAILDKSIANIVYSKDQIEKINLERELSNSELTEFDAFSSRFLRLYEVLINQVIRTVLSLLNELQKTNLDNLHKAEQLYLITSSDDLEEIRKLRNQVAHEYLQHQWIEIYKNLILFSEPLLESCRMTRQVINERFPDLS